jgi:hypothetical protein
MVPFCRYVLLWIAIIQIANIGFAKCDCLLPKPLEETCYGIVILYTTRRVTE